jgi:hypothetical protein
MGSGHHQSIWFVTLLYQWTNFVQVFDKKEARRQQIFPGLAEDSKPADFDIFLKEISW